MPPVDTKAKPAGGGGASPAPLEDALSASALPADAVGGDTLADRMGELFAGAYGQEAEFRSLVAGMAGTSDKWTKDDPGRTGILIRPGEKDVGRSVEKATEVDKKTGKMAGAEAQRDLLAGSIVYPDLEALYLGRKELQARVEAMGGKIEREKNRIDDPATRDFLLNVRMASGLVVEVQLHLAATIDAKMFTKTESPADPGGELGGMTAYDGHDAYDYNRVLMAGIDALCAAPGIDRVAHGEDVDYMLLEMGLLSARYGDIQAGLMKAAWKRVTDADAEGAYFERLKKAPKLADEAAMQDLSAIKADMKAKDTAAVTKYGADLQKFTDGAKAALAKIAAGDASEPATSSDELEIAGILRRYGGQLAEVHAKKASSYPGYHVADSAIGGLIAEMDSLASRLEATAAGR